MTYAFSVSQNEIRSNLWRAQYVEIVFVWRPKKLAMDILSLWRLWHQGWGACFKYLGHNSPSPSSVISSPGFTRQIHTTVGPAFSQGHVLLKKACFVLNFLSPVQHPPASGFLQAADRNRNRMSLRPRGKKLWPFLNRGLLCLDF